MQIAPLLSVVVLALAGCRSTAADTEVAFERVDSGLIHFTKFFGENLEAKNAVIRDFPEWQAFCGTDQTMWYTGRAIDWSKQMLIAVCLGARPSGGYAVEIDRIYRKGSHWIVHARETRPAAGSFQTAMITSPFDCVATPRFDGRVEFIVE